MTRSMKPTRHHQHKACHTSYTMFVLKKIERFSFSRMATRLCAISALDTSWCSLVFAKETMEQYTVPSSATVVAIIER